MRAFVLTATVVALAFSVPAIAQQSFAMTMANPPQSTAEVLDPADSAFRLAREALNAGDTRKAADLFKKLVAKFPNSPLAPDALYWRAYALHQYGAEHHEKQELADAWIALRDRTLRYPDRTPIPDADALEGRILSAQAALGDKNAAWAVRSRESNPSRCPSSGEDPRVVALRAFASMDPALSLPVLRQILTDIGPCTEGLRRTALENVSRILSSSYIERRTVRDPNTGDIMYQSTMQMGPENWSSEGTRVMTEASRRYPEALDALALVATTDPSTSLRSAAFQSIGRVQSPQALHLLDSVLASTNDPYVRQDAILALGSQRDPMADSILRRVVNDERLSSDTRRRAMSARKTRRPGIESSFLRGLQRDKKYAGFADRIAAALENQENDAERFLLAIVPSPEFMTSDRTTAASILGVRGTPTAVLVELFDRVEGQLPIQSQLLFTFGARADSLSIDKLFALAKRGTASSIGREALGKLAKTNDPRVPAMLLELMKSAVIGKP